MKELPKFSQLWAEAWRNHSADSSMMIIIGLIGGLPLAAISLVPEPKSIQATLVYAGLTLAAAICAGVATMAIYAKASHPEIHSLGDAFRIAGSHFWRYITTQIIQGLIIGLPILALLAIIAASGWTTILHFAHNTVQTHDMQVALWLILIFLVGILVMSFWAYRFMFSGFIVFGEDIANRQAIRSSYRLTKGWIGEIWKRYLIFSLCLGAISIAISIIEEIVTLPLPQGSLGFQSVDALFSVFENIIFLPLGVLFLAGLYHAIKPANSTTTTTPTA